MKIRKIKVNNNEYEFINEVWSNYRSWGHESWLMRNGYEIGHNRVTYSNRTWENYEFQSCMLGIVWQLLEDRKAELKEQFKEQKGISRLTKKYEEEFNQLVENDELYKEYIEVRTQVRGKVW